MKSIIEEGFVIGRDMPPLPEETWRGIGLFLFTDLPSFPSTSSETLVTWSNPEEWAITTQGNTGRNGIIRWYDPITGRWLSNDPIGISGGLNQYVFCGDNPVMFVDPWGLVGDGDAFVNAYMNRMMIAGQWNPALVLNLFDLRLDIGITQSEKLWNFRGKIYPSDRMGNIAAGYFAMRAWGPIVAWTAMMSAEAYSRQKGCPEVESQDAYGSFRDNAIGMMYALMDDPSSSFRQPYPGIEAGLVYWRYWGRKAAGLMWDKLTGPNSKSLDERFRKGFIFNE